MAAFLGLEVLMLWFAFGTSAPARVWNDPQNLWNPWFQWDAVARYHIAQGGYGSCQRAPHNGRSYSCSVFQPAQPWLGLIFSVGLGLSVQAALMLVSLVSLALALAGLYRLVLRDYGTGTARWTLAFLITFPTAFFLVAPYAESLLLACAVWAFLAARSDRPWIAGTLLGVAIFTKVGMVFLFPALATEALLCHNTLRARLQSVTALAVPACAAMGALLVVYARIDGSPLSFVTAQRAYERALAPPWVTLAHAVRHLPPLDVNNAPGVLDLAATSALIVATLVAVRYLRPSYSILLASLTLLFTSTTQLTSNGRYALEAFPLFILPALASDRHRRTRLVLLAAGGAIEILFLWLYSQGYWAD